MKLPSLEKVGRSVGQEIGGGLAHAFHAGKRSEAASRNIFGELGAFAGNAAPLALMFRTGGKVNAGPRGRPVKAIVHSGEYILPINAKPTAAQKRIVAMNKRNEKTKKK